MGIDYRDANWFNRQTGLLMDDCLVLLEQEYTKDRVRRVLFDRVESVVSWRRFPWGRGLVFGLFFGLPALFILSEEPVVQVIGVVFLLLFLAAEARYLHCGLTRIRITRAGHDTTISVIMRPGKLRRFLDRLYSAVEAHQAHLAREVEERERLAREAEAARFESGLAAEPPPLPTEPTQPLPELAPPDSPPPPPGPDL